MARPTHVVLSGQRLGTARPQESESRDAAGGDPGNALDRPAPLNKKLPTAKSAPSDATRAMHEPAEEGGLITLNPQPAGGSEASFFEKKKTPSNNSKNRNSAEWEAFFDEGERRVQSAKPIDEDVAATSAHQLEPIQPKSASPKSVSPQRSPQQAPPRQMSVPQQPTAPAPRHPQDRTPTRGDIVSASDVNEPEKLLSPETMRLLSGFQEYPEEALAPNTAPSDSQLFAPPGQQKSPSLEIDDSPWGKVKQAQLGATPTPQKPTPPPPTPRPQALARPEPEIVILDDSSKARAPATARRVEPSRELSRVETQKGGTPPAMTVNNDPPSTIPQRPVPTQSLPKVGSGARRREAQVQASEPRLNTATPKPVPSAPRSRVESPTIVSPQPIGTREPARKEPAPATSTPRAHGIHTSPPPPAKKVGKNTREFIVCYDGNFLGHYRSPTRITNKEAFLAIANELRQTWGDQFQPKRLELYRPTALKFQKPELSEGGDGGQFTWFAG